MKVDGLYHIIHLPFIIMVYFCNCYKTMEHAFIDILLYLPNLSGSLMLVTHSTFHCKTSYEIEMYRTVNRLFGKSRLLQHM
jgi:hypothetical protein